MKRIISLTLFLATASIAQDTFAGRKLTPDTLKIPGVTVWKDSAKQQYVRIVLAPRGNNLFLAENNQVLMSMPVDVLTDARIEYILAQVNLWIAERDMDKAKEKK